MHRLTFEDTIFLFLITYFFPNILLEIFLTLFKLVFLNVLNLNKAYIFMLINIKI